jgi:hypothetical protein
MELWELVARESIRDLVARYNANGDSGRFDALMALFADDAVLEVVDQQTYRGRDEIRSLFTGAAEGDPEIKLPTVLRHHVSTHQIDLLSEQLAKGRCYFVVFTESGPDHWGRYEDEYREVSGRWLFATRKVRVDARVAGGWGDRTSRRLKGAAAG